MQCRVRVIDHNVQVIRPELGTLEFNKWKELSQRGVGITWYEKCILINAQVSNKGSFSSEEWTNALKALMNSISHRGTDGHSVAGSYLNLQ